jgi:hypothetical protein
MRQPARRDRLTRAGSENPEEQQQDDNDARDSQHPKDSTFQHCNLPSRGKTPTAPEGKATSMPLRGGKWRLLRVVTGNQLPPRPGRYH